MGARTYTRRPPITPAQIAEIAERLPTAHSLRRLAAAMGIDKQALCSVARPMIAAMRRAGTLAQCDCGRERFHPRICSRTNNPGGRYKTPEHLEKRGRIVAAIKAGDTFEDIGRRFGITKACARSYLRWLTPAQVEQRKAKEKARYARGIGAGAGQAYRDPTYALIAASVPRWPSQATREDAISDLYLAVLEGSVSTSDIAREARRYATRAVIQWESRYGPRSLDEPRFEGSRDTFADSIADPATLEPLEYRLSA